MNIKYCKDDNGRAYYTRGHVDIYVFQEMLAKLINKDDPIMEQEPEWCWMRMCRNFHDKTTIIVEAIPHSRGAFPVTWVQDV